MPMHAHDRIAVPSKKRRPKLAQKEVVCLPASFIMAVGIGVIQLGMVFYLREVRDLSPVYIGAFVASWQLSYIISCMALRFALARLRPKAAIMLAAFFMGSFVLCMLYSKRLSLAFLTFCLAGSALALFWPPLMGWLSDGLEGKELNHAISRINTSWSSGTVVSPFISGLMSDISPELPIYAAAGIFLAISLLILMASLMLPDVRSDRAPDNPGKKTSRAKDQSTALRFPAWVCGFSLFIVLGVMLNIFPLFTTEMVGLSKSLTGILLLIQALSSTFAYFALGRLSFWHFKARYLVGAQIVSVFVVSAFLASSRTLFFIPLLLIFGFLSASSYVQGMFYGASGSSERSKRMAVHESVMCLGIISGSSAGGYIYQHSGMPWVFGFCIAVLTAGLAGQLILLQRIRGAKRSPPEADTLKLE